MSDDPVEKGARAYREWHDAFMTDPENRRLYEQEAVKAERWLEQAEWWQMTRKRIIKRLIVLNVVLLSLALWQGVVPVFLTLVLFLVLLNSWLSVEILRKS